MKRNWISGLLTALFFDTFDAAKWLEKHGGDPATALNALNNQRLAEAEKFKTENYQAREAKRTESERADAAEARAKELEKKIPADGALLLSPDEAKAFQELLNGKKVTEFKAEFERALSEVEGAKQATRALKVREIADLENMKASVLEMIVKDKALEIVEKDGKKSAVVQVDEKTQLGVLEFAEKHFPDLMPALTASGQAKKADGSAQRGSAPKSDASGAEIAKSYVDQRYSRPTTK